MASNSSIFYPGDIVTFQEIMGWDEEELSEEQRRKAADYLTLKNDVRDSWSPEDKKRFLRVKKILATQKNTITDVSEAKAL